MNLSEIAHPRPKNKGSKQIFQNPWLERLTRTHIAVPVTAFIAYSILLLAYAILRTDLGAAWAVSLFFIGLATFTLFEYGMHRYIYHLEPTTDKSARFQYKVHGIHHEYPKDKDRLALPPWITLSIYTLILWGLHSLVGDTAFGFFSGFLLGYASYLLVHYSVHIFAPPKNAMKALWVNHAVHHYKDHNLAFGVSSPVWDYVFGTAPTEQNLRAANQRATKAPTLQPAASELVMD